MSTLHANEDGWLMIRREDAAAILEALEGFGEWGYRPLDFERVRQARAVLEQGLVTPDGEPITTTNLTDAKMPDDHNKRRTELAEILAEWPRLVPYLNATVRTLDSKVLVELNASPAMWESVLLHVSFRAGWRTVNVFYVGDSTPSQAWLKWFYGCVVFYLNLQPAPLVRENMEIAPRGKQARWN